jgi:succinate dehydrogenase hydrophobic anchor subunit
MMISGLLLALFVIYHLGHFTTTTSTPVLSI